MFAGKKSAQIREILINESAWEEMTCLFAPSLGDDKSATDRLIVEGNTSGSTTVYVKNAGGSGAATLNGIELITVNGDESPADAFR